MIISKRQLIWVAAALGLLVSGCTTSPPTPLATVQNELEAERKLNADLLTKIEQTKSELQAQRTRVVELSSDAGAAKMASSENLLPPNAKPGECYSRVLVPAIYQTKSSEMLESEATYRLDVVPAEYQMVEETVLVKEASETAELVPARYEWVTETVLVKEAQEELRIIPPEYATESEQVLVKAAYTTWKKGRGPIEKVDNATGEIMCLVEVPAEYKTVTKTILASPSRTEKEVIPAEYKEIKKRVMVEPPRLVKIEVPAEYKAIKVKKLVAPPKETRVEIPAKYQTVTNKVKVSDSYLEWRNILCETNTTPDLVRRVQNGLLNAGHNPGPIDGIFGNLTLDAVKSYQIEKGLARGQITMETLTALGVEI